MKWKRPPSPIGSLLGSESFAEQKATIEKLAALSQAPVFSLLITHDERTQRTTVSASNSTGAAVTAEHVHRLLDAARVALVQSQEEAKKAATVPPAVLSVEAPSP